MSKNRKMSIVLALMLAIVFLAGCTSNNTPQGQGTAFFTITDRAADMGNITAVTLTIDSISVHKENESWVTVSSTPQTFDLLRLKAEGAEALLGQVNLTAGNYEQVRLTISKAVVTDASGDHEAKLPSGELKLVGGFTIEPNSTAVAKLDFVASSSVHVANSGRYILAPVLRLQTTEGAQVDASDNAHVQVSGGQGRTDRQFGMDASGNVAENGGIPADAQLED